MIKIIVILLLLTGFVQASEIENPNFQEIYQAYCLDVETFSKGFKIPELNGQVKVIAKKGFVFRGDFIELTTTHLKITDYKTKVIHTFTPDKLTFKEGAKYFKSAYVKYHAYKKTKHQYNFYYADEIAALQIKQYRANQRYLYEQKLAAEKRIRQVEQTRIYSLNRTITPIYKSSYKDNSSYRERPKTTSRIKVYDYSNSGSGGGSIRVKGYTRKDGTYVRPHTRRRSR